MVRFFTVYRICARELAGSRTGGLGANLDRQKVKDEESSLFSLNYDFFLVDWRFARGVMSLLL